MTSIGVALLTSTDQPLAAAGPTVFLLVLAVEFVRQATMDVTIPYLFADDTRETLQVAHERLLAGFLKSEIALVLFGGALVIADAGGLFTALAGWPLEPALGLVGSATLRSLALGALVFGLVLFVGRGIQRLVGTFSRSALATAFLPLCGLGLSVAVLFVAVMESGFGESLRTYPALAPLLAGIDDAAGLTVVVVATVIVVGFLVLLSIALLCRRIPSQGGGVPVAGGGLALLAVAVTLLGGSTLSTLTLVVVAVLTIDVGRFGTVIAEEIGRRHTLRTELVHGVSGVGVGFAGTLVAVTAASLSIDVPSLPILTYVLGLAGLVGVLVLIGRQLSS